MSEKVKVEIIGQQVVRYHQIVEMDKAEFDAFDVALSSDDRSERREAEREIGGIWIDTRDVCDADDIEIEDIRLAKDEVV